MRKAIAIVAYDRSHYFRIVVPSILAQKIDGKPVHEEFDIFIFQDGLCEGDEKSNESGHEQLTTFAKEFVDRDNFHLQDSNLGVALHFDYIEKLLFVDKEYDFVLFCEDDLVLAPGYAHCIAMMAEKFAADPRVGMVSANPADMTLSIEKQLANLDKYAPMAHNWGFGIAKDFWLKRQPMVEEYLDLVRPLPYRSRPTSAIENWLLASGFDPLATSQDFIKQCATLALGAARISTRFNLGLPIGRSGLHCNPKEFERMGLDRSVVSPEIPTSLAELTQDDFASIFANQSGPMRREASQNLESAGATAFAEAAQVTPTSEFQGEAVELDPTLNTDLPSPEEESGSEILKRYPGLPVLPHMEPEGIEYLINRLESAECLLEYGAGGSTVLAARLGIKTIISVESDIAFLEKTASTAEQISDGVQFVLHAVDIGPTGAWGRPTDTSGATNWPSYCSSIWQRIKNEGIRSPDLILVDGRFRPACLLVSMAFASPGTIILFDDYFDRPHYHVVERYFEPTGGAGRMAEFTVPENVAIEGLLVDLLALSTNCD